MKRLRYRLTSVAPIVISSEVGDPNIIISRSFIPGGTIRGAMANIVIKDKTLGQTAHTNDDFRHWFLNSGVRFTNAYIENGVSTQPMAGFPIPFSVQKEKKLIVFTTCFSVPLRKHPMTRDLVCFPRILYIP